ncbi:MAG: hypothetical protein JWO67_3066 [Streptosporangiaceae bacterium]|nr:hypothetical protein [Streptosporangiaceae bacterium]
MRVQPLPQHRIGDVIAVEPYSLVSVLQPEHRERIRLLPMHRHLQVQVRRTVVLPRNAVTDLAQQSGLPDPTHADDVENPRPPAEPTEFFRGRFESALPIDEAAMERRDPAEPRFEHHSTTPAGLGVHA